MGFFAFVNSTAQGRKALRRRFRRLDEIEARIGLTDKAGAQAGGLGQADLAAFLIYQRLAPRASINRLAAKRWGLTDAELQETQESLTELEQSFSSEGILSWKTIYCQLTTVC